MQADPQSPVLTADAVRLGQRAEDRSDAVRQCGSLLVEIGSVEPPYVDSMLERETIITTYVGEGIAIPHSTDAGRAFVRRTALAVVQFPEGVDWGGETVRVCVAIAALGDEHLRVLSSLAEILLEPGMAEELRSADTVEGVLEMLRPAPEETDQ